MSAVRALLSPRKPRRMPWIRRESSSPNDQLEAPVTGIASCQARLQPAQERLRATAEHLMALPGQVIAEQAGRLHALLAGEIAQRRQPSHGTGAEEVTPMAGEPS